MRKNCWQKLLIVSVLLLSLGVMLTFQKIGKASPDTVLSVDPEISVVAPGQSFNITIKVTDVSELYAWQFNLTFNPTVLNVTNVTEGPFLKQAGSTFWAFTQNDIHNDAGWVFAGSSLFPVPAQGATGSGVLATVTLRVKAEGISSLHFSGVVGDRVETSLATWDSQANQAKAISFSAVDGVFKYPPTIPVWRDLTVADIAASPTSVPAGEPVSVNVTVRNLGNLTETFNATAYYDSTAFGTRTGLTLDAGAYSVLAFTWDTTGVAQGTYALKAAVTFVPGENDTTNNVLTKGTVIIELVHNVAVTDLKVSPSQVASGGEVSANVTVMNKGSVAETFDVTLSYDSTVINTETLTSLMPGASRTMNFVWNTTDVPIGDYVLTAKAGPVSGETKTADNTFTGVIVKVVAVVHDVAVTNVSVSPSQVESGGKVSVNVTIMNKGTVTETFNVTLSYDSTVIKTETVTNLEPNSSKTLTLAWETKDVPTGDYELTVTASPISGETQTTNNTYSGVVVKVTAPARILPWELMIGIIIVIMAVAGIGAFLLLRRSQRRQNPKNSKEIKNNQ